MLTMPLMLQLAQAPKKPPFREPCNGCGFCCLSEVCRIGIECYGDVPAPCPAMRFHDGRFWCGVVEEAEKLDVAFGAHLKRVLSVGVGCDAETGDEVAARESA